MKTITLSAVLLLGTLMVNACQAQATDNATAKPKVEQAKPTEGVQWLTDMGKAIQDSKATGKPIMLFFTGSDWCGWCKRLQNEVFFKPEFITWANENVIPVELDFPRAKKLEESLMQQNQSLQQLFGIQGYPTVVFVNASEPNEQGQINLNEMGRSGYLAGGPKAWTDNANTIIKK